MNLRGVDNEQLDWFDRENHAEPPNEWVSESPAVSQELRWVNEEHGEVMWAESETSEGSPYAIFLAKSPIETADVVDKEFEDLDELEVEAIKIMEEIEESREEGESLE